MSLFLWDCWAPDQHQFHSNGHSVFCFIIYIYLNSKYFPLIHSWKKIQTNCLFFSFKYNIKISFSATPLGASLKFLMSHHLCSIHGGFRREREVGTRWRGCFHQRRIVPGWQSSQEYMMCFRRRRGKAKMGKILLLWVSPRQRHCSRMTCFRSLDAVMQAIESYMVFSLHVALKW